MNEMKHLGGYLKDLASFIAYCVNLENTSIANLYRQTNDPSVLIPSFSFCQK